MSRLSLAQAMMAEYEHESHASRAMLERVPEESFDWQPHEKSMTLGRLAAHVAESAGWAEQILAADEFDFEASQYQSPVATSRSDVLQIFEGASRAFRNALDGVSDERMLEKWVMRAGERVITESPRVAVLRGLVMSHLVHHRGQLSVYLRLLDVPVPPVYGPTADEQA